MKARVEPWGAWVAVRGDFDTTNRALVALDRVGARRLGISGEEVWASDALSSPSPPLEVHVSVTSRCAAGCSGCYVDARPRAEHVAAADLFARVDELADLGVFTIALGGGEPLEHPDLEGVAEHARKRGIAVVMTTSGIGLGRERARRLAVFEQVNVSYDGAGAVYESVRGVDAARHAERAIEHLAEAGVRVGVNVVLTRTSFEALADTSTRAAELGAREIQCLRYKPAGRAKSLDYLARRLAAEQILDFPNKIKYLQGSLGARTPRVALRIDCALVPWLVSSPELASDPDRLSAAGILGCEAGGHLAATTSSGHVAGCSFLPATRARNFDTRELQADPDLARIRDHALDPPAPCNTCALQAVCRGGCRVVAEHLEGPGAPDPECPRVVMYRRENAA